MLNTKRHYFENIRKPFKSLYPQIEIPNSLKIRIKSISDTFFSNRCKNDNKQRDHLEPHLHLAGNPRFFPPFCIFED